MTFSVGLGGRTAVATSAPSDRSSGSSSHVLEARGPEPLKNPKALGVVRMVAATDPSAALAPRPISEESAKKLRQAKAELDDLGNRLLTTSDFISAYGAGERMREIVGEHPELASAAIQKLGRSFDYMPMQHWTAPIASIRQIAAGKSELYDVAIRALVKALDGAKGALANTNVAMQQHAVTVESAIASIPSLTDRVFDDLLPLLRNPDPYAAEMTDDALDALGAMANRDPEIAQRLREPVKARLELLLQIEKDNPSASDWRNGRYTVARLINRTMSTYARIATKADGTYAAAALETLQRAFTIVPKDDRAGVIRLMSAIGEAQPSLARAAMEAVIKCDAKLDDYNKTAPDVLPSLAQAHGELATEIAHYLRDRFAAGGRGSSEAQGLRELVSKQPAVTPVVIADLTSLLDGPRGAAAVSVLADIAWQAPDHAAAILAQVAGMADNGSQALVQADIWSTLVSLANRHVEHKPAVKGILRAHLQQLTQGPDVAANAPKMIVIADLLRRLDEPQRPSR